VQYRDSDHLHRGQSRRRFVGEIRVRVRNDLGTLARCTVRLDLFAIPLLGLFSGLGRTRPMKAVFRIIRFHANSGAAEELEVTSDAQTAMDIAGAAERSPGVFVLVEAACAE
jgi:hypothetical protein